MKTLHLTNAYHPTSGGIRTFYRGLLQRANDRQRALRLVVPAEEDSEENIGRCGRIYYVKARPAPAFDRRYRLLMPTAYLPPSRGVIGRILEAEQPHGARCFSAPAVRPRACCCMSVVCRPRRTCRC